MKSDGCQIPQAKRDCTQLIEATVLGLLVAFTSSGFIQKYGGDLGLAAYFVVVTSAFIGLNRFRAKWSAALQPYALGLGLLVVFGLVVAHLGLHQLEDGRGPGRSSDRDEGLEIAVSRLLGGENPYYPSHPEAGPLSLLPGAILLAIPFVVTGWVGLQNAFWVGVFLSMFRRSPTELTAASVFLACFFICSPSAQYEIVSGGDMIANGAYVVCFLIFATNIWSDHASRTRWKLVSSLLLGMGLASRANFILLLPLWSAFTWRVAGLRPAFASTTMVIFAYLACVVPFYFMDPEAFTPLKSREKIMFSGHALEWADEAILGLTLLASGFLTMRVIGSQETPNSVSFCRHATWIILAPMVLMVGLASVMAGHPDFRFMHDRFGLMLLFSAMIGFGGFKLAPRPMAPYRAEVP